MPERKSCLLASCFCSCPNSSGAIATIPAETRIHLSRLSDYDLCKNAQGGCNVSSDFLWDKYHGYIRKIVFRENHHQHLPQYEMEDVLQELYFAFHDSVLRFDPENHCKGTPASFKTFLRIVIVRKFSNCCALSRRYHNHTVPEFESDLLRSNVTRTCDEYRPSSNYTQSLVNWLEVLVNDFSSSSLVGALRKLNFKEKCLLALWLGCNLDKDIAELLGISPIAAKLRRERLFRRIRQNAIEK